MITWDLFLDLQRAWRCVSFPVDLTHTLRLKVSSQSCYFHFKHSTTLTLQSANGRRFLISRFWWKSCHKLLFTSLKAKTHSDCLSPFWFYTMTKTLANWDISNLFVIRFNQKDLFLSLFIRRNVSDEGDACCVFLVTFPNVFLEPMALESLLLHHPPLHASNTKNTCIKIIFRLQATQKKESNFLTWKQSPHNHLLAV